MLALITIILKAVGKYNEGDLRANSGYLYVSIVYNVSICMALYCLAIFWMCVNDDLKPFRYVYRSHDYPYFHKALLIISSSPLRPMPKFLCVKGILFFSFWQGIFISVLVAAGVIKKLGPYTDSEHISLALTDALVCLEMPFFAIAHQYAFSTVDFVDPYAKYVARMPMGFAFRDAFGLKDVVEDCKSTFRGEGMDYREFEPSEGFMHQGAGRDRRIRAGLRYSQGGKRKYWLPQPTTSMQPPGNMERRVNRVIERVTGRPDQGEEVYAPLLPNQEENVVHLAPDLQSPADEEENIFSLRDPADADFDLPFGDLDPADDELFIESKKYLFGDYNYPVVDVSSEYARMQIWHEEERILRDERGVFFSPIHALNHPASQSKQGYGATDHTAGPNMRSRHDSNASNSSKGKGKVRVSSGTPIKESVIDKEQDREAEGQSGDVHLRWTKLGNQEGLRPQAPRIRTLSSQGKSSSSGSSSAASSAAGSPRDRAPPTPRRDSDRPVLPPDAVDLVVEDPKAAHEESSHDRRRGEPAGLRKAYRRGYVVEGEDGKKEGEVEIEEDVGEPSAVDEDVDAVAQAETAAVEGMTITQATTPPAHARVSVNEYDIHEENPWA